MVALLLGILIVALQGTQGALWVPGVSAAGREAQDEKGVPGSRGAGIETQTLSDTIIIGWDGVQRDHFWQCYTEALTECAAYDPPLANLRQVIGNDANNIYDFTVTDGSTDTKAGWVQILTGYDVEKTGVYNNVNYQPLSEGYSIFEKLETFSETLDFDTIFVSSKGTNVGVTCPGYQTVDPPGVTETKGEPWCLAQRGIDTFEDAPALDVPISATLSVVTQALTAHYENRSDETLVAFFHFREPDHTGHVDGENSTEYTERLLELDDALGEILDTIEAYDALGNTLFYVVTDHGFDEGRFNHFDAPFGILATNDSRVIREGDRKDLAPTILEQYGVEDDPNDSIPAVDGHSLYSYTVDCVPEGGAWLDDDDPRAPACCEGLTLIQPLDQYNDWPSAEDRCLAATGDRSDKEPDKSGYCTACGNDVCSFPETVCNCPEDCEDQSETAGHGGGVLAVECPLGTVKTSLLTEAFASWPPQDWTVVNNGGDCVFHSSGTTPTRPNNTGGEALCASVDSDQCGEGTTMDTELWTPVLTVTNPSNTYLQFKTFYLNYLEQDAAAVDVSTNGGVNWTNVLTWRVDYLQPTTVDVDLTPYVGSATSLRLRWRYVAPGWDWYWEVDDVDLAICAPAEPDIYLTPEDQTGAGCPGKAVEYELELWNDTSTDYTITLDYDSNWLVTGPETIFVTAGVTVSFPISVEVGGTGVDTATITATAGISEAVAQVRTWGHMAFKAGPDMETPRADLAVVGWGNWVFAIGGSEEGEPPTNKNECLGLTSGQWTPRASMPISLTLIDGAVIGGVIYIPGGYDGEEIITTTLAYTIGTNTWGTRAGAPRAVAGYGVAACGGLLYRVGGSLLEKWPTGDKGAEVYDPETDQWDSLGEMWNGHLWPGVVCKDDVLYVAGGLVKYDAKHAEFYDTANPESGWNDEDMHDLLIDWWGSADFLMGDVLFLAGGYLGGDERAATAYHDLYWDSLEDEWTLGPALETPRYRAEGDLVQGAGYVFGGWADIWDVHSSTEVLESCQ